ncbi:MAG TPA: hypothetical protein ENI76_08615 [Ignavibacteria bacterium]|nr:hypothetical protein [Ignavibacteria bacterium]
MKMTACKYYPKFEPNQVLTSEQLNQLTTYFDKHDRLTRSKLIGVGIVCGFKVKYDRAPVKITITEGVGITTEGYLIYSPQSELIRYKPYKDSGKYDKFGDENSQIQLWELLPSVTQSEDETIEKLTAKFLEGKAIILYLERYEQDLETCTGDDCNEKGKRINHCIKKLLINLNDLADIIKDCSPGKGIKSFDENVNRKFRLPEISIGREANLISENDYQNYDAILKLYQKPIKGSVADIQEALYESYKTFEPVLSYNYNNNPFNEINIGKNVEGLKEKYNYGIQYIYDYLKDIILSYNEFKEAAFDLTTECCYNERCFPRHLMLGEVIPDDKCDLSVYRHSFIQPPIYNGQNELLKKVKMLFRRLVYISYAFHIETGKSIDVKITPSREKGTGLSERSIPYYYRLNDKDPFRKEEVFLHHIWNYEFIKKCKPYLNLAYYSHYYKEELTPQFVKNPLLFDTDKYGFYRIEGHLNKPCNTVLPGLLKDVDNYNLPFKVMKLDLGKEPTKGDLKLDCRFTDLELMYKSLITEYACFLHHKIKFFAELDFNVEKTEEQKPGTLKGTVYATTKNKLLPGVNVILKRVADQVTVSGSTTNQKGIFTIKNIQPGQYVVSVDFMGFESYSLAVTIKSGETENIMIKLSAVSSGSANSGISEFKGFRYTDMSKQLGLGARYNAANIAKTLMAKTYKRGDFLKKSGEYKLAHNSVGNLYLNYGKHGSGNLISYIEKNQNKFVNIIGGYSKGNIIDRYYRPVKLIGAIEALASSIPEKIINFNEDIVETTEKELIEIASDYKSNINENLKNPDYIRTGKESEILIHLTELIEKCVLKQFQSFIKVYKKRVKEILKLTLFTYFIHDHSGVVHMAGVPAGGTFIIVCNEEGTVVADFALPYICCSDCPPITFVAAPVQVVFKLPNDSYCSNNDTNYTVIAEPPGGEVKGDGISKDTETGEYKFNPKQAGAGLKKITYFVNLNTYELLVNVIKLQPNFTYSFDKPEPDSPKRTVKFTGIPIDAESYSWDFGDGEEGATSQNPEHTFDLTDKQEFDVTLTVKKKDCTGSVTETIKIPYCTAEFIYKIEKIVDKFAVVSFDSLMIDGDKYAWTFGDNNISSEYDPLNKFDISKKNTFDITLKVKKDDCSDEESKTITINSCTAKFVVKPKPVEGNKYTVYFDAETADADEYIWNFGDGTPSINRPQIKHQYILKDKRLTVTVKLTIKNGICTSTYSTQIKLPPAEKVEFSLKEDIFCKYDETPHEFTLSIKGKVVGPGVEPRNGKFVFIPTSDDVEKGINTFVFNATSGGRAELTVRVLNPVANFKIVDIIQPNPEINPATYRVNVKNLSKDAKEYIWKLDNKKVFKGFEPEIIITRAKPGRQYNISLVAINNKCSNTKVDVITIPTRAIFPSDGGDNITVHTFKPDNIVVGGSPDKITTGDNIIGSFNNNVDILNNLTSHNSFKDALSPNVAAFRDTKKYLNNINKELKKAETKKLYITGAKDNEIAKEFSALLNTTVKRIEKYKGAGAQKQKQFTYNLVLLQLSQLFNLIALQKEDIKTGSRIELMLKWIGKTVSAFKKTKIDINPENRLSKMIGSAFKAAENKPVLMTVLERFSSVLV